MKKLSYQRMLVFLSLFLLAAVTVAQDWKGRGRLQGRVLGPEGEPVQDATIRLLRDGVEGRGPEPIQTNKKGRWAYTGLSTGSWSIWIDAKGLQSLETVVQVNEYAAGKPVEVTLGVDAAAVAQAKGDELTAMLNEANQLVMDGKPAEARGKFETILAEVKDEAQQQQLKMGIAQTYLAEENYAEALSRYQALLPSLTDEQKPSVMRMIARAEYGAGDIGKSIQSLEQIVTTHPDDVETTQLLIQLLMQEGREKDAQVYMAKLPAGEKVDADTMLNLGISAFNAGNTDEALQHFNKVVQAYPSNVEAYYNRGMVLLGQGESAGAIADFEKLLELSPDHPKASEVNEFLAYLKSQ